ncbi:MAG: hypothetical protein AAGD32_02550, partial [Planctomycetota bacterium]
AAQPPPRQGGQVNSHSDKPSSPVATQPTARSRLGLRLRGNRATWLSVIVVLSGGCGTWTDAQVGLVDQAKRGTELLAESNAERSIRLRAELHLRRAALDAAFDADVRDASVRDAELDADWVIAHRQAYAIGLDALHKRQLEEATAADTDRRNARAALAALDRLAWLLDLQRRAARFQPLTPEPNDAADE